MTPTMWWRLVLVAALVAAAWYVVHLIRENEQQTIAIGHLTSAVNSLNDRAKRVDEALAANDLADDATRSQANRGVGRIENARRTDSAIIAIDKPWPASVRGRVFDNPDPASGSTAPAEPARARVRGKPVQKP